MKFLKNVSCLFLLILIISSCTEENFEESGVDVDDSTTEMIDENSIMTRTNESSEDGLEIGCFTIVFPFTLIDDQNNEHLISSIEDLEVLESDSAVHIINIEFPFTILQDGSEIKIENEEEFAEVFAACVPEGGWTEDFFPAYLINFENSCYQLSFPLQLLTVSNETITVNNEEEFNNAIAAEDASFVFPIELIDEDGNVSIASDIDGLFTVLFSCNGFETQDSTYWDWEQGFEYLGCYKLEFPINLLLDDGTPITVNNHTEFCDLLLRGGISNYTFPLSLIDSEGNTFIADSEEALNELLQECYTSQFSELFGILIETTLTEYNNCFDYVYPVGVKMLDSTSVEINSDQEFIEFAQINFEEICCLAFPVDVIYIENEERVTIENEFEYFEILGTCD